MLNTFLSNVATGLATKNRYRISISGRGPSAVGGFSEASDLMCESIEFPGQNFSSSPDLLRYGPSREAATGVTYAPITASFMCSPDMREKRFFEVWQSLVMDMDTWEPRFYQDYIGGMKIYQLDRQDNSSYMVELFEVYPKTITAQDLGYATNDAYHTIAVELIFHHWKWARDRTPWKTVTSESVIEGPIEPIERKTTIATESIKEGMGMVRTYAHTIDKDETTTTGPS